MQGAQLLKACNVLSKLAYRPDITVSSARLLLEVAKRPGELTAGTLSDMLGVSGPSVTRALDTFDAGYTNGLGKKQKGAGLIKRIPCPDDRRVKLLDLTKKGREFVEGL